MRTVGRSTHIKPEVFLPIPRRPILYLTESYPAIIVPSFVLLALLASTI